MENTNLEKRANGVTEIIDDLISEIHQLESDKEHWNGKAGEFEDKLEIEKERRGELEERVSELESELRDANKEINQLQNQIQNQE